MSIQLLIKSPNQQVEDVKVDCDVTWSISRLKEHLANVYPTKPDKKQQRIIYAGRVLPDDLLLKSILVQDQTVYTMHLVCPSSTNVDRRNVASTSAERKDATVPQSSSPYSSVIPPSHPTDGLRQRLLEQTPQSASNFYSLQQMPSSASSLPASSPYVAYQMAMMQQSYAQAMAQYLAQANAIQSNNPVSFFPNQTPLTAPQAVDTTAPVPQNVNEQAPQEQQNADDGDGRPRDLLDNIYVATRFAMLCLVLYYYSSLRRVLIVLILGSLLLVWHLDGRRQNRRAQESDAHNDTREEDTQIRPGIDQDDNQAQQAAESDTAHGGNEVQNATPELIVSSAFSTCYTIVKTFFASLIPENIVQNELN